VSNKHFPHKGPRKGGMLCSLSGVLKRSAETARRSRDNKHLEWSLLKLNEHIETIRESQSDEEALETLDLFLSLWVKH